MKIKRLIRLIRTYQRDYQNISERLSCFSSSPNWRWVKRYLTVNCTNRKNLDKPVLHSLPFLYKQCVITVMPAKFKC